MIVYSNAASNRVYFSGSNPYPNPNAPRNPRSSSLHFQNPKLCHSRAQSQSFMALHLCKPKHRSLANPSLIHFFSTSQNDNNGNTNNNFSQSPLNSYFSDVKASLKNEHQSPQTQPFSGAPRKVASIEEIKKNLSEFRERSAAPNPTEANRTAPQQSKQPQSFQELYKRNTNNYFSKGGKVSIEAIKESLRQMKPKNSNRNNAGASAESSSFSNFSYSLRVKPEVGNTNTLVGGTQELPKSVFEREMREEGKSVERDRMKTEFVKMYSYEELGAKLRTLRPGGLDGGFSFGELNERLMKLRELEEKENESRLVGVPFKVLRDSLANMKILDEEKSRKSSTLRHVILGQLGATPEYMQYPPQKHLVEKYFHPDNMSSTEKLKIALAKVREEFKMSESDCGSARVQIAQLTTKIKHLSLVLHKKDKHSLKGLQAMVQRRKRLLKYLRRTDWDSYCFVLSKLGLRDNPEYKTLS